jgi:hypothetical protein
MRDADLIEILERIRSIMISVSTGGLRIQDINDEYKSHYRLLLSGLSRRAIENPIHYQDLYEWYGHWSSGDLPTYQSRRKYISDLLNPIITQLRESLHKNEHLKQYGPTGWTKVDRTVGEIRIRLSEANTEEQFQVVGLLCREALISLAQAVYDPDKHQPLDEITPSDTDAKRMLVSVIAKEFRGSSNENARRHARISVDLAVELQHRRTANFRQAALCVEATTSVINVLAIIYGLRDP